MSDTDKYEYSCSACGLKCAECGRGNLTSVTYIDGRPVCSVCVARIFPIVTVTTPPSSTVTYCHAECPDCKRMQADLTATSTRAEKLMKQRDAARNKRNDLRRAIEWLLGQPLTDGLLSRILAAAREAVKHDG